MRVNSVVSPNAGCENRPTSGDADGAAHEEAAAGPSRLSSRPPISSDPGRAAYRQATSGAPGCGHPAELHGETVR